MRCIDVGLRWWRCHRFFYTARKNPSRIQRKLAFRKVGAYALVAGGLCIYTSSTYGVSCRVQYDPVVRQHVLFSEVRISRAKPR